MNGDIERTDNNKADTNDTQAIGSVMMVGGGSGGHLTPLLAVAMALKRRQSALRVTVVGQRNENLQEVVAHDSIDQVYSISAGKFRRYHGESFLAHVKDVKTIVLNIRDFFRFMHGIAESWRLLGRERPDVIFLKGGFVCVPVGIAAQLRRIPYFTHDSDAIPGLANRIVGKRARINMTAMPAEMYPYRQDKTVQVGIPLRPEFSLVTPEQMAEFKNSLGVDPSNLVLCCMGGGLGAQKLNRALAHISRNLLEQFPGLVIMHVAGQKLFTETEELYKRQLPVEMLLRIKVYDFYNDLFKLSGAADVVVTRAGATSIAELAVQAKPSIIVPNPVLTGGQQLQNARALEKAEAAVVVHEDDADALEAAITDLLASQEKRSALSERFHTLAYDNSTEKIVDVLLAGKSIPQSNVKV